MKRARTFISYTFAAMAGIFFVKGLAILTQNGGVE